MLELFKAIVKAKLIDANTFDPIDTSINYSELLFRIIERDELPTQYKLFLKYLNEDEDLKHTDRTINITTKVLRLYIHARTSNRGNNTLIKNWITSGSLPNQKYGSRISMVTLGVKVKVFNKSYSESKRLISDIKESERSKKNITNAQIKSLEGKQARSDDHNSKFSDALDEIFHLLEKIETLIASGSDT